MDFSAENWTILQEKFRKIRLGQNVVLLNRQIADTVGIGEDGVN